jgi:alkylation response protein AidB-like acyl-CoA dehydrogenase
MTQVSTSKWVALARELGKDFATRTAQHDANDTFVAENYAAMRQRKLFSANVPSELGGGGASYAEVCAVLRELGRHDASTALSFSMHSHLLATLVWRHRHGLTPPAEPVLRRIAAEELVLATSGGSDWVDGSGTAVKVDGGYKVSARKIFGSGSPSADLFLTMAIYEDPKDGPTILHFATGMKSKEIAIQDDWRVLGMRGTGSNSVVIENLFVPEGSVTVRRPKGKWHRFFDIITPIALGLILSVYVGIAERAREIAVTQAAKKRDDPVTQSAIGEMETELATAQGLLQAIIDIAGSDFEPSLETSNRILCYRTAAGRAAMRTVDKAIEAVGGSAYFRNMGLERCFRDVQGVRFHPIQERKQYVFSGRHALGLDPMG